MTNVEKLNELNRYCGSIGGDCIGCLIGDLCNTINGCFNGNSEYIEKAYSIIEESYSTTEHNNVDHPNHYNQGGMECIDEMLLIFGKDAVMNFCLCNAWKYRYRANAKNGQEDLDKANWYINKYKELKTNE